MRSPAIETRIKSPRETLGERTKITSGADVKKTGDGPGRRVPDKNEPTLRHLKHTAATGYRSRTRTRETTPSLPRGWASSRSWVAALNVHVSNFLGTPSKHVGSEPVNGAGAETALFRRRHRGTWGGCWLSVCTVQSHPAFAVITQMMFRITTSRHQVLGKKKKDLS